MQLVRHSLADAWHALKGNWIIVWFPVLVGIVFSIFAVILAGFVINFGLGLTWSGRMGGTILMGALVAFIVLLVAAAIGAGQTEMFRGAASGESVQVVHFSAGVKRFAWRFLGSYLVLGLFTVVIAAVFMSSAIYQLAYLGTQLLTSANNSPVALLYHIYQMAPTALLGSLLLMLINFVLGTWNMFVVADDTGVFAAYVHSVRLITGNLRPFLILGILSLLVSLSMQAVTSGGMNRLGFVFTILSIIWASYYQLARFILFYQLKAGPTFPPLERQGPPELLV